MLNSIRKISTLLILAPALCLLFSCKNESEAQKQLLAKKWRYSEFRMNEEVMPGHLLGDWWMDFSIEGKYEAEIGPRKEKGEWSIEKDELVTQIQAHKEKHRVKIAELTENKLVLTSETDTSKATITLVPYIE